MEKEQIVMKAIKIVEDATGRKVELVKPEETKGLLKSKTAKEEESEDALIVTLGDVSGFTLTRESYEKGKKLSRLRRD